MDPLTAATQALRDGAVVLLYDADGREEETDMVALADHVDAGTLRRFRRDAGGLVCACLPPTFHQAIGLPFEADCLRAAETDHPVLGDMRATDLQYDANPSSFGITVNHRSTRTGITDNDRATTTRAVAAAVADAAAGHLAPADFGAAFRSPGHVHLLNGHPDGIATRQGHTELSLELARQATGRDTATLICEMLGDDGNALSRDAARAYAAEHGLVFLDGAEVLAAAGAAALPPSNLATVAA